MGGEGGTAALSDVLQRIGGGIEHDEAVLSFSGRTVPVITNSERRAESGGNFPGVRHKSTQGIAVGAVGPVRRIGRETVGLIGEEGGNTGEAECARRIGEVGRVLVAELSSQFAG